MTKQAEMHFYGVDLDLFFSKAPFIWNYLQGMSMVEPTWTDTPEFDSMNGVSHSKFDDNQQRQSQWLRPCPQLFAQRHFITEVMRPRTSMRDLGSFKLLIGNTPTDFLELCQGLYQVSQQSGKVLQGWVPRWSWTI